MTGWKRCSFTSVLRSRPWSGLPHELKGFAKVALKAGETQRVTLTLDREAFAYYDVETKGWLVAPGEYSLEAAHSSREIRLRMTIGKWH